MKAKRLAVLAGTLSAAAALTVGAATPSPQLLAAQEDDRLVQAMEVELASVASALQDVIEAYAAGTPPTEFPAELTAFFPGLETLGPQLLAALGSDENTEFIRGLSLVDLISQLGVALPDGIELPLPDFDLGGAGLDDLGLKIITTGPPFFGLNLIGLDLGTFTPAFPNQIANEINSTDTRRST